MSNPRTITFVTLASNAYWLGFAALVESIRTNSQLCISQYKFMVYSTDPIPEWVKNWARERSEKIEFHVGKELNDFVSLSKQRYERLSVSIKKLGLFGIPHQGTDRHIFVDSDMLCLGSLSEIFQFEPFAGVPNSKSFLEVIDGSDPTDHINGGFFIFEPSKEGRDELFTIYQTEPDRFTQFGDQDVIAEWVRQGRSVTYMPSEWNCLKGWLLEQNGSINLQTLGKVRILHFTGESPWEFNSRIRLNEGRYLRLELMWWRYLKGSGLPYGLSEFRNLNPFVAYKRWLYSRSNRILNRLRRMIKGTVQNGL